MWFWIFVTVLEYRGSKPFQVWGHFDPKCQVYLLCSVMFKMPNIKYKWRSFSDLSCALVLFSCISHLEFNFVTRSLIDSWTFILLYLRKYIMTRRCSDLRAIVIWWRRKTCCQVIWILRATGITCSLLGLTLSGSYWSNVIIEFFSLVSIFCLGKQCTKFQSLSVFRWKEMLPALKGLLDKLFCNHQNIVLSNGFFRVSSFSFHLETEPHFKMYFFAQTLQFTWKNIYFIEETV